jgi:GTPase
VIVTDTVGFIRDLPQELVGAFRTTLEELREADLLLHVVDVSAPDIEIQITAVVAILEDLQLDDVPRMLVFNKSDRVSSHQGELLCRRYAAIGISALQPDSLHPLFARLEEFVNRLALGKSTVVGGVPQEDTPALASRR